MKTIRLSRLDPKGRLNGLSFVAFVALSLLLGGNSLGNERRIRLRVSGLPNTGQEDSASRSERRVLSRFKELNPDIDLESAEGLRLANIVDEATTIMMIAGDIAPDVLRLNFRSMDTYVRQGIVAPLDEYAAIAKAKGENIDERIPIQVRPVVYRQAPDGEKKLYGLPSGVAVMGLRFNREIFRKAGLPMRAPQDWKELDEFCKKICALGPEYKGIHLRSGSTAGWHLINFLWSAGGDAVKEVAPNEWRAAFNTPEAVAAYKFYYKLCEIDRTAVRASSLSADQRAHIGMIFGYTGDALDPKVYGFGTVPKGPTGLRGAEVNATVMSVYSQIKDPVVKEAAWRYILFVTGSEAERIRTTAMVELGEAPQVNPDSLRRFGFERFLSLTPPGFEEEYMEALKHGKPEPYGKNCNLIYQEMTYPLDQILLSEEILASWKTGDTAGVRGKIQAILDKSVARTNERMIGYVPPETMQFRRVSAAIVLFGIVCAFVFVGWYVARIFSDSSALISRPVGSRSIVPWLCILPALGLILMWSYIPLARGTVMAFQDYQIIQKSTFVGLDNFANALFDSTFWYSLLATVHFAAYTLTLGFAAPILLAYALHMIPKYKILYRTVYYLPSVISATAVFFLWSELFGTDGPFNAALRFFGFEARRAWTEAPHLAMLSCVLPGIWAGAGPGCLIYLAALKTIPEEQFEASEIDGAGFLHKTLHIIFPGLRALIAINFIGAVGAAFHGATNILIMTGGGPNGMTEVISLKIFFEAFTRLRFGPATAMAWVLGSMLIGLTVLQLKRLSRMEFKTAK